MPFAVRMQLLISACNFEGPRCCVLHAADFWPGIDSTLAGVCADVSHGADLL